VLTQWCYSAWREEKITEIRGEEGKDKGEEEIKIKRREAEEEKKQSLEDGRGEVVGFRLKSLPCKRRGERREYNGNT
jgi:hypothetical protein